MIRTLSLGASTGALAAISLSFAPTPAHAASVDTPDANTAILSTITPAGLQTGGMFDASVYDAEAQTSEWRGRRWGRRGWGRRGWGRRGWGRRGIGAGEVIAGVAVLGGIAAIASAANNRRDRDVVIVDRDRRYDRRDRDDRDREWQREREIDDLRRRMDDQQRELDYLRSRGLETRGYGAEDYRPGRAERGGFEPGPAQYRDSRRSRGPDAGSFPDGDGYVRDRVQQRGQTYVRPVPGPAVGAQPGLIGIEAAVDRCVEVIEIDASVSAVDGVVRTATGWSVSGQIADGESFTCQVDREGQIRGLQNGRGVSLLREGLGERAAAGQWSSDAYAGARAAIPFEQGVANTRRTRSAYSGGALLADAGDEFGG